LILASQDDKIRFFWIALDQDAGRQQRSSAGFDSRKIGKININILELIGRFMHRWGAHANLGRAFRPPFLLSESGVDRGMK